MKTDIQSLQTQSSVQRVQPETVYIRMVGFVCFFLSFLPGPKFPFPGTVLLRLFSNTAPPLAQCVRLGNPMDRSLPGSSVHGNSPGKNTGAGCHALLQGTFPTQGSNPNLLHLLH